MKNKIAIAAALVAVQAFFASAAFAQSEIDKCKESLWQAPGQQIAQLDMSASTMEDDMTYDQAANDEMAYEGDDIAYNGDEESTGSSHDADGTAAPKAT